MADNVSRLMAYLNTLPVAVSGAGGHNATLRVACECFRFGVSDGEAWDCLQWFNDFRCQPKWSEHDLRHKLADAHKITAGGGQVGKHLGGPRRNNRPARVFVAPPMPARRVQPAKIAAPIYFSDDPAQEQLWLAVVTDLGYASVPEFDAAYDARRPNA